jgi:hypothetical protein
MDPQLAAENLQAIRTLMERSAIYRRALAPILSVTGIIGLAGGAAGFFGKIGDPQMFVLFWLAIAATALSVSFFLVRMQAIKDREPFWSPPTRRVSHALLPSLAAGAFLSLLFLGQLGRLVDPMRLTLAFVWMPIIWAVLYGCALHSAGFFTPSGLRLLGWAFVAGGCFTFALGAAEVPTYRYGHAVMGGLFGGLHLICGLYLYVSKSANSRP